MRTGKHQKKILAELEKRDTFPLNDLLPPSASPSLYTALHHAALRLVERNQAVIVRGKQGKTIIKKV